ncbi:type I-F CRISPR-associated endonuclease Cas1 [Paracoccus liaowanqingii]|uniref:CRISPR-associated endonuclease Cas1 n=1 Tax=Paracoccus liaowanqingii TaxID=2560053 RepID=A0A4Z1CT99_9RHOB|nr:type I-F CRISPR-associated endonuclease Cas1f [Paracoccus liaowanqingii]TGN68557.1 type I-F CRISPR-associated endonuclease Cas1 [Paracoccus liaowanqingii]
MSAPEKRPGRAGPRLLVTQRAQALFLERARVHADNGRVLYRTADDGLRKEYSIPHANLALLFLGQGTSLTQEAGRLLAEENVYVAFTGSGGSPLHFGALTTYTGTSHFRRMLTAYADPEASLSMARALMRIRIASMQERGCKLADSLCEMDDDRPIRKACSKFEGSLELADSIPALLGYEGDYTKSLYAAFALGSGLSRRSEFKRIPRCEGGIIGPAGDPAAVANSLIDHGNYLANGFAGAALWALGIPPHMPVFHGKTRSGGLVFDLADTFKEAYVMPTAFAAAMGRLKGDIAKSFRGKLIDEFSRDGVLACAISTLESTLPCERLGDHVMPRRPT